MIGAEDALGKSKKWFKEAQFGMMAHWGLYTLLGGEWRGKPGKHPYGEWIMHGNRIPLKEYAALAKAFNPVLFDPMDWMKRARDAGMKYFVITSKHHDGFAMYHSRVSKYNIVDTTPFGRDPVRDEIVCRLVVPCGTVAEVPRIGKTFGFGAREFKLPTESNVREGKSVW